MGVLLLLLTGPACVKHDGGADSEGVTAGYTAGDTGDTGDTGAAPEDTEAAVDCAGLVSVSAAGQGIPGEPLTLDASGPAAAYAGFAITWTTPHGEVVDEGGGISAWTPDAGAATHEDEVASVGFLASSLSCPEQTGGLEVTLGWPDRERVVVVYNPSVAGSEGVALDYAALHEISDERLCGISSDADTTLPGDEADAWLAALQRCLDEAGPQVHYIVPVYGAPYRVSGRINDFASGSPTTTSLDALMVYGGVGATFTDAIYAHLYQDGDSAAGVYEPYVPFGRLRAAFEGEYDVGIWLVARMDAADAEAASALVARAGLARDLAAAGALEGVVYVDGRYGDAPPTSDEFGSYESGEWNMWGTRTLFEALDWYEVVWDGSGSEFGTEPAPLACPDALYYAGWYTYYNYNDAFTWAPGAIGGHLDSCSACDIRSGGVDGTWAAGALERGITATFGAVAEPYVAGMPEYDQFFRYLTEGASYGEAAYESTVVGAWMMVWIGDPLYRPHAAGG